MTALALIWARHQIAAAVDSLESDSVTGASGGRIACKIRKVADVDLYYIASGMIASGSANFVSLASEALTAADSWPRRLASLDLAITPALRSAYAEIKANSPSEFEQLQAVQLFPLRVVVFGALNGRLCMATRQYDSTGTSVQPSDPSSFEDAFPILSAPGSAEARFKAKYGPRDLPKMRSRPVEYVREFVLMAVEESPATVGLPLSLLSVKTSGAQWIQRGPCYSFSSHLRWLTTASGAGSSNSHPASSL